MLVPCVFKLVASCRKALAPPPLSYQQLKRSAFINSYTPLNYTNINRLLALSYVHNAYVSVCTIIRRLQEGMS